MNPPAGLKLVVGLGNPGKKYQRTRHNIGFEVLRRIAQRHQAGPGRSKFDGFLSEVQFFAEGIRLKKEKERLEGPKRSEGPNQTGDWDVGVRSLLLMPHTYMNASGGSVRQTVDFYKIERNNLLVVCDDFHLNLGSLRIRARGTDGGQKGLADIIQKMGNNQFSRLRIGIGPVPARWNPADFVLGKFADRERDFVEEVISRSADAVRTWATEGTEIAMNRFNTTNSEIPEI
jgi:peptidyl-tRNA hydrolase, PTH1 family